jgi:hypothetical protein
LQTLSLTTDGYTPSPKKSPACPVYPDLRGERSRGVPSFQRFAIFQDPEIRPGRSRSSLIMDQGSRITNRGPDSAPRAQNQRTRRGGRTFAQQFLCLPYLRISWRRGEG